MFFHNKICNERKEENVVALFIAIVKSDSYRKLSDSKSMSRPLHLDLPWCCRKREWKWRKKSTSYLFSNSNLVDVHWMFGTQDAENAVMTGKRTVEQTYTYIFVLVRGWIGLKTDWYGSSTFGPIFSLCARLSRTGCFKYLKRFMWHIYICAVYAIFELKERDRAMLTEW